MRSNFEGFASACVYTVYLCLQFVPQSLQSEASNLTEVNVCLCACDTIRPGPTLPWNED